MIATTHRRKRTAKLKKAPGGRMLGLREALGASRTFSVTAKPHGPFSVASLLDELKSRLVSRGGRPSDSAPTIRRLVPLRKQVWEDLQRQANILSSFGKHVSPGQLAAMLLERSVSNLEVTRHKK